MPNRYDVRAEKITTESSDSKSFILFINSAFLMNWEIKKLI